MLRDCCVGWNRFILPCTQNPTFFVPLLCTLCNAVSHSRDHHLWGLGFWGFFFLITIAPNCPKLRYLNFERSRFLERVAEQPMKLPSPVPVLPFLQATSKTTRGKRGVSNEQNKKKSRPSGIVGGNSHAMFRQHAPSRGGYCSIRACDWPAARRACYRA
jgi:hypothetical protein